MPAAARVPSLLGDRADVRHVALVILATLAIFYTLHFARAFFLPIVLALLLDFLLRPVVRALRRARIPEPVGAGLAIIAVMGAVGIGIFQLAGPAGAWVARAPETMQVLRDRFETLRRPVARVTEAAAVVEEAADVSEQPSEVQQVEIKGPGLVNEVFGSTTAVLGAGTIIVFLSYLLLAARDLFLQKLVTVLPQFRDKRKAVLIARETEEQISAYLFTAALINLGVGAATAAVLSLLGMPNPILWGAVAAVLNFAPYIGAVATVAILGVAALLTFENTGQALAVPGAFIVINLIESNLVTPFVMGRRMRLNPVALFIGLVFWWFLWGIPGAILAVPIMAAFKIVCDHVESLAPVGEFLGE
ncbi:MAG TPA: AI-2E family transporter [Gemmatimonadales bacterium]|nr:AI-2E family transporter [Gemmatimonadales bacterium]